MNFSLLLLRYECLIEPMKGGTAVSDNNLIPVRRLLPERVRKEEKKENYAIVSYEKTDSAHYSFFFDFDNGYSYRMNETEALAG